MLSIEQKGPTDRLLLIATAVAVEYWPTLQILHRLPRVKWKHDDISTMFA
jgi:hypothetical protein